MATTTTRSTRPTVMSDVIWALIVGGFCVAGLGALLAVVAWPRPDVVVDSPGPQHTGDAAFAHACLVVSAFGCSALLVGLTAVAVRRYLQVAGVPPPAEPPDACG